MSTAEVDGSPAADPPLAARSAALPLVFGLAVGGLTTGAFLGGALVRAVGSVAVPIASITALLLLGATPLLRRVARWAGSPRPERAAAWSLFGVAPLLFLGANAAIGHDAVVTSHWRCGTGDMGLMILSPIAFMITGALGGLTAFGATAVGSRRAGPTPQGIAARVALVLAGILACAATFRALHRPSTDGASRYVESLPAVAVLAPMNRATAKVVLSPRNSESSPEQREDETRFRDITARRTCSETSCSVRLLRADSPPPEERMWATGGAVPADATVVVRRDEKHGFLIVGHQSAFRERDLQLTDIRVEDVGDELSAPTGWILGGFAGIMIALALSVQRRRFVQRLLRIEAAREAVLGDNGWMTSHDDSPAWRASPDLALASGPVVLIGRSGGGSTMGVYRSEGARGGDEIVPGTREALAAALRRRMGDLDALALVTVAITASPLLAAWGSRLIF